MSNSSFYQEVAQTTQEFQKAGGDDVQIVNKFEKELSESEAFKQALRTGAKIPNFSLPNAVGKQINIQDLYRQKPLVVVFYRGQWCPFCNIQLRSLQQHLAAINGSPANLVAISPQTPDHSLSTVQKFELSLEVLSDVGSKVGKLFNLVYTLPDYLTETYKKFGVDVEQFNGKGQIQLPYPATYIIDREGFIIKDFISAHLNERLDPKEVTDFLTTQLVA